MILLYDFGSQYTNLISRQLKYFGIKYVIIQNFDIDIKNYKNIKGIILSGGPDSAYDFQKISDYIVSLKKPLLAICLGMQLLSMYFNLKVIKNDVGNYGIKKIKVNVNSALFKNLNEQEGVLFSHGDCVKINSNKNLDITSHDEDNIYSFEIKEKNIFCLQFHPEASEKHIKDNIFKNFLNNICNEEIIVNKKYYEEIIESKIKEIKKTVKENKVLLALSGGVDSTVAAFLINKAIGFNLNCFYIDSGMMRIEDKKNILLIKKQHKLNIKIINARRHFISSLKGITDPQKKRKIIGRCYIEVFNKINDLSKYKFLAQGTIFSDVIESSKASANSKNIKHHHNVSGIPKGNKFKLLEPFKEYFKSEVIEIGKILEIKQEILFRHPFPGPGLAIRILGEVNYKKIKTLQKIDAIFIHYMKENKLYAKSNQAFAILLPIKSVGVQGDKRTYKWVCILRSICSKDYMTCEIQNINNYHLSKISKKIISSCEEINRVCYDITSKPPGTIEWE